MRRHGVIVFDLDGTYWQKEPHVPPDLSLLIQLLAANFSVAVCSGNEARHVIRVLVYPLLQTMYEQGQLALAQDLFVFFQLGGGLARFDSGELARIQNSRNWASAKKRLFAIRDNSIDFQPDHIDSDYVDRQSIDVNKHGKLLDALVKEARAEYKQLCIAERKYYDPKTRLPEPKPNERGIRVRGRKEPHVVQYTLKPLYSEMHYTKSAEKKLRYEDSIRYKIAQFINGRLKEEGVGLTATAAGGTSVDITNHDLSKTTAIEYLRELLDHEKYQNFLYFGDELHLGGNDVVVPLELKITTFSVGKKAIFHPCVFAAPQSGPQGTFAVLHSLLGFAPTHHGKNSAVAAFREEHARRIVVQKLGSLSAETLQSLALIATAGARDRNVRELHEMIADQVRIRHEDQRPPGASHWTDSM